MYTGAGLHQTGSAAILGELSMPEIASRSLSASGGLARTVKNNRVVIARGVSDEAILSKTQRESLPAPLL